VLAWYSLEGELLEGPHIVQCAWRRPKCTARTISYIITNIRAHVCPRIDNLPFFHAPTSWEAEISPPWCFKRDSLGCTSPIWIISSESISSLIFNIELMKELHKKLFILIEIISLSQVGDPNAKASLHDSPGISGIASGSPWGE
jgi:hypothetical protein